MAASRSIASLVPTLAASLGLLSAGCAAPGAPRGGGADEMTLGESQSGTSVVLAEGGSLTLELPVTSGTGYVWEVRVEPRGMLQVPAEPLTVRSNDAMPGSVTQQRWILTGARVGAGTVEASYRRPWEKDVAPAKRFSVSVRVEPAKVPSRNP
jgi:inhibitor of cysteine peptidase